MIWKRFEWFLPPYDPILTLCTRQVSSESESDIEEGVVDPNDIARVDALSEHQVYKLD